MKRYFEKAGKLLTSAALVASLFIMTTFAGIQDLKAMEVDDIVDHGESVIETYEFKGDTWVKTKELVAPPVIDTVEEEPVETVEEIARELTIEERIALACDEYDISYGYDIVLAIARLETGWFKSDAYIYGNNPGGLSVNEVPIYFDTIEEGVDRFVSNLALNYFGIGLTTPELIGQKYCPVNPGWAELVRELMYYEY